MVIIYAMTNFSTHSDIDGSGTIDFDEFIRVCATYCMFTKDEIMRFCFECFDVDGSGTIDEHEFVELCK
jgi:Ca2+-binding EF-hand superfamily protein